MFQKKYIKICAVICLVFFIAYVLLLKQINLDIIAYQERSQYFFSQVIDGVWSPNRLNFENNLSLRDLSSIYITDKQLYLDPENLYASVINKFMSPWLKAASKINGRQLLINEEFRIFSSAHFLELQLLSSGHFNHFRITRYRKTVINNGSIQWIRYPGKPILQSVVMPCSGLASHGLTPNFLKDNQAKYVGHAALWRTLQHIINVSRDSDLPDHVDIFIVTDDYPWLDVNREYRLPKLRQIVGNMREISILPPLLNFCTNINKLDIPFMYLDQLIEKPIEKLIDKLKSFQNRSDNKFEVTLSEFKKRNDTALWRGGTSGQTYTLKSWLTGQRSQLVQLSMMAPHLLDARFTTCLNCERDISEVMNISFGSWINTRLLSSDTYFTRKFLVDIDGNGWSSRLYELMLTGATVFKIYRGDKCDEFWYDFLRPGIDFVPIASDFHDLFSKLIYYRKHPEEAYKIANNGMQRVSFLLRAESWPRYGTGVFRAISALQTKPDAHEEQQMAHLGLTLESCTSMPLDYCNCKPL